MNIKEKEKRVCKHILEIKNELKNQSDLSFARREGLIKHLQFLNPEFIFDYSAKEQAQKIIDIYKSNLSL